MRACVCVCVCVCVRACVSMYVTYIENCMKSLQNHIIHIVRQRQKQTTREYEGIESLLIDRLNNSYLSTHKS